MCLSIGLHNPKMFAFKAALAAAALAAAAARPLSDAEMRSFYGYSYGAGPTRALRTPINADDTLRSAANKTGVWIGCAANYRDMTRADTTYRTLALAQFDLVTAENEVRLTECLRASESESLWSGLSMRIVRCRYA